jgi:rhamnogalacturonan endolyase
VNIRAGAHYTQFMVYDFDRDGKAEMICKTGPGSMDATGKYVNLAATDNAINSSSVDNKKDWRNSNGRITGGQEYLTVFRGQTGEALHTIFYNPNRNMTYGGAADGSANWGEPDGKSDKASYGNRGERFLAAVAYLDGPTKPASGIFCRGYYGYAFIWAVGFDGEHLYQKWLNEAKTKTSYYLTTFNAEGQGTKKAYTGCKPTSGSGSGTTFANGNHNMSIADVDGDGCDEVIWGSAAVNNDGTLLYGTGFGHGDAIHLGRMIPDRDGFQVFQVHEEKGTYSWDLHDAFTGEIIFKGGSAGVDNGRGMAADIDAKNDGWEFWSGDERNPRSAVTGAVVIQKNPSVNFRIYWDGDLQDELFDGAYDSKTTYMAYPKITKWNGSSLTTLKEFGSADGTPQTCNSTKATPCLQADILGDWREELVMWNYSDPSKIMIYTTTSSTNYRIPTLMHDHTYRMGVCWQNTAYNQPPHVGFCLKDFVDGKLTAISDTKTAERNEASGCYNLQGQHIEKPAKGLYIRNGKKYVAR